MYQPPAVTWDVKPVRWHALVLMALVCCAALLCIAFCVLQGWGASGLALLLALLGATLLAAIGLQTVPKGQLNWDGAQWHWFGPEEQAVFSVACVLDLQTRMLVRIQGAWGSNRWLWLASGGSRDRWQALRRAMVASQPQPEGDASTPVARR